MRVKIDRNIVKKVWRTDRDRQTDRWTENTIHRAAWSQLKMYLYPSPMKLVGGILDWPCPSLYICSYITFKMATWQPYWIFQCPGLPTEVGIHLVRLSACPSVDDMVAAVQLKFTLEFQFRISYVFSLWLRAEAYLFSTMSLSKWPPGSHSGFFSFWTITLVWLWKSSPNCTGPSFVCMGKNLLIFSNVTFKMAAWWPYWIFQHLDSVSGMVFGA